MAKKQKTRGGDGDLFIEGSGQLRLVDKSAEQQALEKGKVEYLGMTFDSEDARRAYFTDRLREKLADPEFRNTPGFPIGTDNDIIRLSDPPYYTACPNPFLQGLVAAASIGKDPAANLSRSPYAADVNQSRNSPIVNAHSYATKAPPEAILRYILHYTNPGDLVIDAFCGTGMTGVAARMAASTHEDLRLQIESEWRELGWPPPQWGSRFALIQDLSPAATFIAANMLGNDDLQQFSRDVEILASAVEDACGWMYKTRHSNGELYDVDVTLWSDVFVCSNCEREVVYWNTAVDLDKDEILDVFNCPHCSAELSKRKLQHQFETYFDNATSTQLRDLKQVPVLIVYYVDGKKVEKHPDEEDLDLIRRTQSLTLSDWYPVVRMMGVGSKWGDTWRAGVHAGIEYLHQFYTTRNLHSLAKAWAHASSLRLQFMLTALMYKSSKMCGPLMSNFFAERRGQNRGGWVGKERSGTLYRPSISSEVPIHKQIKSRMNSVTARQAGGECIFISTQSATRIALPDDCADYIFLDPPFGANRYYSELNFLWESWLGVLTEQIEEAVESPKQNKTLAQYQDLMRRAFKECFRVLKPGKWTTVEFSNTSAAVWNAIQTALGEAGFVVADVRGLHKGQGSINAYVTPTAVKQDLVISAYKPTSLLEDRFSLKAGSVDNVWEFVRSHLSQLPVVVSSDEKINVIAERRAHLLFDRTIAFFVQRGVILPISIADFITGLAQRYSERDGMYFLSTQVATYDRVRAKCPSVGQLELFVTDESSAIQWLRQALLAKPQTLQDLRPQFMKKIQSWSKHEKMAELRDLLDENFIVYSSGEPVSSQIHSYLSSNFKELRNLKKTDPALIAGAKDRWYVPDPNRLVDLEKLRERALLREFGEYRNSSARKLKLFRTEAVRAGFKAAYEGQDYKTIVSIAVKLPENVLQEDEKLLMYYDVASMRLGDE